MKSRKKRMKYEAVIYTELSTKVLLHKLHWYSSRSGFNVAVTSRLHSWQNTGKSSL
jgi:hypothetical protein